MSEVKTESRGIHFEIDNIGGVEHTSFDLLEGTNVLTGKNSTNKTSILKAIAGVLGWDGVPLKSDSEEGYVRMEMEGKEYYVELERMDAEKGDSYVKKEGDRYLEGDEKAERFAYLLKDREPRNIINDPSELYDVIMDPIDTTEIEGKKKELRKKVESLENRLRELEGERSQPSVTTQIQNHRKKKAEVREDIEKTEDKIEELENELEKIKGENRSSTEEDEETKEVKDEIDRLRENELEEVLKKESRVRSELSNIESNIQRKQNEVENLESEIQEYRKEAETLEEVSQQKIDEVDKEITELKSRKNEIQTQIREANELVKSNGKLLDGDLTVPDEVRRNEETTSTGDDRPDIDDLFSEKEVAANKVVSPVTGFVVEEKTVREVNEKYREIREKLNSEKKELESSIDRLTEERVGLMEEKEKKERLEDIVIPRKKQGIREVKERIDEMRENLEEKENDLENLKEREKSIKNRVSELESQIQQTEESSPEERKNEILSQLRKKRDKLSKSRNQLDRIKQETKELNDKKDEIPELRENLQERREDLRSARTLIEEREKEAVEQFNHNMEVLLDMMDYEELDAVWLEILNQSSDKDTEFQMNIVRSTEEGAAYSDTVETLSESEEAVVGLMFGLSGYIAHGVAQDLPFLLIDSLEDFDTDSVHYLLNHFVEQTNYLVAALLPKTVEELPKNEFNIITTKRSDQPS